ncbi:MAG: hypothetical protein AAFN40_03460 [Cyanobacteria bacterium J06560_6]
MTDKQAKIIGHAIMCLVGVSILTLSEIKPDDSFFGALEGLFGAFIFMMSMNQFQKMTK